MLVTTALLFLAAPDARAPARGSEPVRARSRASVRVVQPYRLQIGKEEPQAGAQWRTTSLGRSDGKQRRARLIEFE